MNSRRGMTSSPRKSTRSSTTCRTPRLRACPWPRFSWRTMESCGCARGPRPTLEPREGAVGRAVVDDDDAEVALRLIGQRLESALENRPPVVCRNDDRKRGRGSGHGRRRRYRRRRNGLRVRGTLLGWIRVSEPVNYWDSIAAHSRVEEIWGSHPLVRARINRRVSGDPHTWTTSWLAKRLEGMPRLRETVSIGCGMGHFERDLVRLDLVDRITGIEISPVCVAEARGAAQAAEHAGAHRLPLRRRLGGARALPRPRRDLLPRLPAPFRPARGDGGPPAPRA